jgi:miniconductance mechanosensitive channel
MDSQYNIALWLDKLLLENGVSENILSWVKLPILILGLIIICLLLFFITKKLVVNSIHRLFLKTKVTWDDVLVERKVFDKLAFLAPAILIIFAVPYIFGDFPKIIKYSIILSDVFIVGVIVWTVNSILSVFDEILSNSKLFKDKPITSYIQVAKILIYFMGGIMILSLVLGKSPFYFLGAMGAMTAILLLIFKDTILGFVASIQMSVYDMIRVGDWISMPKYEADGDVISINLNTVKVQNWDKTITTIPTYAFITDSFKNWRGMTDSGGRRIKRAIHIKMSSFKFCDEVMIEKFKHYRIIKDYIHSKEEEISLHNQKLSNKDFIPVNIRRLTNIGVFRIYAENYLRENQNINHEMTAMVRQLEPTSKGLPLEIYCFSKDKQWVNYEKITADIFDHLLTVIAEFELEVFEEPSGKDFSNLLSK